MDNEDIYKLGAAMYSQEQGKYQNPYPIGSPEYNQFERGWMQSLKRDGGHLSRSKFPSTSNKAQFVSKHNNSSKIDIQAALYRSKKG